MNNGNKAKYASLVPLSKDQSIVARSASLTKRGLDSLQTLDRIVHFPEDISIGDVYLFEPSSDVRAWFEVIASRLLLLGAEKIDNVRGELRVPKGKRLFLLVNDSSKLSSLSALANDSLQGLSLAGTNWGEEDSYIGHLTGIRFLGLLWGSGTDVILSRLTKLRSLSHLFLYGSRDITDFGLSHLTHLKSLIHLDLRSTKITDLGLSHLTDLKSLTHLCLDCTKVTDRGLSYLTNLKSLTHLYLGYTGVTDAGLPYVSSLTSLSYLDLEGTNITDEGLSHLAHLKSLKKLTVIDTAVSERGIQKLKSLLPDCGVVVLPCA